MHTEANGVKEKSLLQKALDTLPTRHGVIDAAHKVLSEKGYKISRRGLYEVVKGRSKKPEYIEAILDAIEAAKNHAAELDARAAQLAQA